MCRSKIKNVLSCDFQGGHVYSSVPHIRNTFIRNTDPDFSRKQRNKQ